MKNEKSKKAYSAFLCKTKNLAEKRGGPCKTSY